MGDADLAELLDALDHLAGNEPSNIGEDAAADLEGVEEMSAALKLLDTARARRLQRQLVGWRQAIRRLKRASQEYDRAERAVSDSAAELAEELRSRRE